MMQSTTAMKVMGVFGYPVEHSLSPVMHNAAFQAMGMPYWYVPFAVEPQNLEHAVQSIRFLHLRGVNVTIPHKSAVMKYLDHISPEAQQIGAVNTIVNDHGVLSGYNTDGKGYLASLAHEAHFHPQDKKIVIIGAGGAARAVAFALSAAQAAQIVLAARQIARSEKIVTELNHWFTQQPAQSCELGTAGYEQALREADLVVNSTPIGMFPHIDQMPPVNLRLLRTHTVVSDLIYNPVRTLLLREADNAGFCTLSGLGMLVNQGALSFEKWTGLYPPIDVMQKTLQQYFAK